MTDILRLTLKVLSRQKRRSLSFCLFCLLLFLFLSLFWSAHIHIRQGLEDNLYQNLYNRMVWVDSGETVDANFWDSLGKLPHAEGVLPNLSGLYCTGLDAQTGRGTISHSLLWRRKNAHNGGPCPNQCGHSLHSSAGGLFFDKNRIVHTFCVPRLGRTAGTTYRVGLSGKPGYISGAYKGDL